MRVLHIDRQRHWAGQQVRTYELSKRFAQQGDEVLIACSPGSQYEKRIKPADEIRLFTVPMRGRKLPAAVLKLARFIRREKIDVVDAHGAIDHQIAVMATRFLGSRAAIVRTKHNHTRMRNVGSRFTSRRLTHRFIAISEFVREVLLADGVPDARIDVVRSSIDTMAISRAVAAGDRAAARKRFGIPEGAYAVGTTGRVSPRKGHDVLCRALARIRAERPEAHVVWVAAASKKDLIAETAAAAGLPSDAVIATGFLQSVTDLFPALDLFLMPSRDEALGVGLLEAMAGGIPAVASACGGIPEVVLDGKTGLLVPPGDHEALAAAIARMRAMPELARACAEAGQARVRERHDVSRMTAETRVSYERAMGIEAVTTR